MRCRKTKFLSLLLTAVLLLGLVVPFSASAAGKMSEQRADYLNGLHLFQGTGNGYQLGSTPTRMQGLVMLIRMLGLEADALAYGGTSPFTDLTWGEAYAAYAYNAGLTKGTGATTFSPNDELSPASYVTFLLRALGYTEDAGDYTWGTQYGCATKIGLITTESAGKLPYASINRGDMVDLSYAALTCVLKGEEITLAEKLVRDGVFTEAEGIAAGVLNGQKWTYDYEPADNTTIFYEKQSVSTSGGQVTAHVLRVNTDNPNVTVKSAIVDNVLDATDPFKNIVADSGGAVAVVNANFFSSYSEQKLPIGHFMLDGELLCTSTGISSLGIGTYGELSIGRPAIFTRIATESGKSWAMYDINVTAQSDDVSVVYTPAYGTSVTFAVDAYAMIVANGRITSYQTVPAGTAVAIPANGYVSFMGKSFVSTYYFVTPVVGETVTYEPFLFKEDEEGFDLTGLVSLVSGAPRLVQDGQLVTELEAGFTEARFTTLSTCRTAVGIDTNGYLVLVYVPSATIQQMRELMLALGCVDAFNLDGGGSCGMYYNGTYYATPGRELTTTIQVFVSE